MHQELRNSKGFGILEIVIASAIIGSSLFAMLSVFIVSKDSIEFARQKLQASLLAEEGIEVLKFKRDSNWTSNIGVLSENTKHYLSFSTSTSVWSISTTPPQKIEGIFERSFYISKVSRDSSANIQTTYNPANDDTGTRKILMTTDWNYKNKSRSVNIETYLVNLFSN